MKTLLKLALICLPLTSALAQVSTTEIYIVNVVKKDKKITYTTPVNITNHKGYDNQPEFTPDGKKLFYVSMPDTVQSEVYEYNFDDSTSTRMTETPESEYSPKFSPDGKTTTMVRVDGDKGQRFYQFTKDPEDLYNITQGLDSIGYYCWINDSTVALACLNNGMELYVYEVKNSQFVVLEKNIGRCMMALKTGTNLIFVRKAGDDVSLMNFDVVSGETNFYCDGMKGVEDYAMGPDGRIYCGNEGKLFAIDPNGSRKWEELADFSKTITGFYRLAVSPDGRRIALVAYEGKKP